MLVYIMLAITSQFIVDWKFYFVPDDADAPPYTPLPTTPYNVTNGRTYYYDNPGKIFIFVFLILLCSLINWTFFIRFTLATGVRNMKEVYDEYCIPVFGNPFSSMGHGNKYSCDFLNVRYYYWNDH